ncbi:hypothetical protein E4U32_000114 [Claviceps aff. humidiphila group G2b]|nr:hypothetical protein E4U32_000114 [Claviceps aff. humidiphila group G2b]
MTTSLQLTAIGWLLLSVAHTINAKDWQANAKFQALSSISSACAKAGWYQGTLLNYAWSQNPALLHDPVHKVIAGTMVAIMWVSGWWYSKNGVTGPKVAVGVMGALQAYAAFAA